MNRASDAARSVSGMNLDGGVHHVPIRAVEGRLWLCGKHAIAPDVRAMLERTGSSHVVCLVQRHELVDRYDDYVEWLDAARHDGRATWFPIHDLTAPEPDEFVRLVGGVHARLTAGEGVVVHCAAGKGRAGTLAVAVCLAAGMPLSEAIDTVRLHRPGAGPEVGDQHALVSGLADSLRHGNRHRTVLEPLLEPHDPV